MEGRPFEVWGGEQLRDFTYVEDAVDAFLVAGCHPAAVGQVYNLGGPERVSLLEAARLLVEAAGRGEFQVHGFPIERKKIDIGDFYADDRLIFGQLGWRPETKLRMALRRTLNYFEERIAHYI